MRVVFQDPPDSFDPAIGSSTLAGWDAVTEVVYFGGMLAYDQQNGGPAANIAARMPTVSADGTTLTFTLRPDVRFHNGRVITADDFKYSWERVVDPKTQSWGASYLANVVGYDDMSAGKTAHLAGVEVLSPTSLRLHLQQPDFTILNAMCLPITAPVPKEEVARLGATAFGHTPVGYGPFKVESYDGSGQRAVFVRNPAYMYRGLPYIDRIEYRWGIDPSLQLLQLEHGDADLIGDGVPSTQVAATLANPNQAKFVRPFPSPGVRYISLYQNHPELADKRVRQALNWAVDREAIGRVVRDASPWGGPFPKDMAGLPASYESYGYNVEKARALLSEAGVSDLSLTLTFSEGPPYSTIAQILQQQYQAINVHLSLNQVSTSALYSLEAKQTPQLSGDTWYLVQPTPADILDAVYITKGSSNYNKYSNPQVDTLAKKAAGEFKLAERNAVYGQIEQLISDDAPAIFLMSVKWLVAVSPKVQNYQYRGETFTYYDRLWF